MNDFIFFNREGTRSPAARGAYKGEPRSIYNAVISTKEHEEEKRIRNKMIPMGNTLTKHGTMADRESKVLWGSRGRFFKRAPWSPKAKK